MYDCVVRFGAPKYMRLPHARPSVSSITNNGNQAHHHFCDKKLTRINTLIQGLANGMGVPLPHTTPYHQLPSSTKFSPLSRKRLRENSPSDPKRSKRFSEVSIAIWCMGMYRHFQAWTIQCHSCARGTKIPKTALTCAKIPKSCTNKNNLSL